MVSKLFIQGEENEIYELSIVRISFIINSYFTYKNTQFHPVYNPN